MRRAPLDIVAQSRGRFAPNVAIPRILDVLDRLNIKATFFTPGWTIDQFTDSVKSIVDREHELAAHGYLHERLAEITFEAEEQVFDKTFAAFKKVDCYPVGFRAPY